MPTPSQPRLTFTRLLPVVLTTTLLGGAEPGTIPGDLQQDNPATLVTDAERQDMALGNNRFAWEVFTRLCTAAGPSDPGNLCFSPVSLRVALTMAYAGARGKTADEMRRCLQLGLPDTRVHGVMGDAIAVLQRGARFGVELTVANSLWIEQSRPLLAPFLQRTRESYGSAVFAADFIHDADQQRLKINAWAAEHTQQRIQDVLPKGSITPLTRLVLVNAVHFKAPWSAPFEPSLTRREPWANGPDRVAFMHQTNHYGYAQHQLVDPSQGPGDGLVQILEAPYAGHQFSLVVLLPSKSTPLEAVIQALDARKLTKALDALTDAQVDLRLPKMALTWGTHDLGPQEQNILPLLGMVTAFHPRQADFSGMNGDRDISLGGVHHKAFLELAENGAEAAAVTAVTGVTLSCPGLEEKPPVIHEVRVDRPFLFLIRQRTTGTILFLGRCRHP